MGQRDAVTGMLTPLGSTPVPQSDASSYLTVVGSADGLHLYGLAWDPGSQADWAHCSDDSILLEAWGRNPVTGALSLLHAYTVLQSCGVDQREWNMPVISSDGADVYVMSPFGLVHQFRRAPATGLLTRAGAAGLPGPYYPDLNSYNWRLVIRPDGGFLYVERGEVLARDPATGALTYAGTIPDFYTPIGFAGDGDLITEGPRVYRLAGPTGLR